MIVNWTVFILFKSSGISDDESSTNLNLETTGQVNESNDDEEMFKYDTDAQLPSYKMTTMLM